jgi:hypothetical protein
VRGTLVHSMFTTFQGKILPNNCIWLLACIRPSLRSIGHLLTPRNSFLHPIKLRELKLTVYSNLGVCHLRSLPASLLIVWALD